MKNDGPTSQKKEKPHGHTFNNEQYAPPVIININGGLPGYTMMLSGAPMEPCEHSYPYMGWSREKRTGKLTASLLESIGRDPSGRLRSKVEDIDITSVQTPIPPMPPSQDEPKKTTKPR